VKVAATFSHHFICFRDEFPGRFWGGEDLCVLTYLFWAWGGCNAVLTQSLLAINIILCDYKQNRPCSGAQSASFRPAPAFKNPLIIYPCHSASTVEKGELQEWNFMVLRHVAFLFLLLGIWVDRSRYQNYIFLLNN
jgi:hypothetical protein